MPWRRVYCRTDAKARCGQGKRGGRGARTAAGALSHRGVIGHFLLQRDPSELSEVKPNLKGLAQFGIT